MNYSVDDRGKPGMGRAIGTMSGLLLAGVVPIAVILGTNHPPTNHWLGPLMITLIAGLRFAWIVGSSVRRPFEMSFWLFGYVFFGLAAMVQLRNQIDPATTPNVLHYYDWTASIIIIVGMLSTIIGSWIASRRTRDTAQFAAALPSDPTRMAIFGAMMLVLAMAYIVRIGAGTFLASRSDLANARFAAFGDPATTTLVTAAVSMGLLVSLVAQLRLRAYNKANGIPNSFLLLILSGATLAFCVNFISSPRFVFGTVLLATLTALGIFATVKRFRLVAALALFSLVFVFPAADAFRRSTGADFGTFDFFQSLSESDFDSFAQVANTAAYVDLNGITWGRQALGVLLFWLPRGAWPDKPVDTGILLADFRGYNFTNLSAPLFAEMYINFGIIAVIVLSGILGYWLRRWDTRIDLEVARYGIPTVIGAIVPFYMLIMLRGSLLQSMLYLTVILVGALILRRPTPRDGMARQSRIASAVFRGGIVSVTNDR